MIQPKSALHVALGLFAAACITQPALAEIPDPVRAMVEAAIATGDEAKVRTVIELAKQTNPDEADALDEMFQDFRKKRRELAAAEAKRKEQEIREAGVFERWSGKGQVGAFRNTGNSDNVGVSLALSLERTGIDWQHRMNATADYQRSNGVTSREQYLFAYEPRYQINSKLFSYALAQYERDRFQGFSSRYSVSGGLGYKVFNSNDLKLSVKAGPSWRQVDYTEGTSESGLGGLVGLDFDWNITDALTLTQDANMVADSSGAATLVVDSTSTSVLLTTGLEARISNRLSTRLSYTIDYDSTPPEGKVSTDTLSRFTLVYGF
ncbi:putative salt-induced outer membrane protein [Altererythrobacter atlanticus]|uniref:Uncharacterized protein n=1 Tax=Croceibacterium atlanticum TaxID=1267766 RepID=A0A0F7KLR5_9SPHN|nr:DUF481 domain-containing protein [Croceibacterium atlanticum]AKH41468.1 hypothetical protein WYH_00409 [Croceibacterium atlanticum]MBB5732930.1 putative salt-induced outer membrane protein [Croceibacterium atlanticum]